jgi:hypothetical protein
MRRAAARDSKSRRESGSRENFPDSAKNRPRLKAAEIQATPGGRAKNYFVELRRLFRAQRRFILRTPRVAVRSP